MKLGRKPKEPNQLDQAIDKVHAEMSAVMADDESYAAMNKQLQRLYKLKAGNSKKRVSPDTLAIIAANVAVTVIIVGYEQHRVVTSKAKDFWLRFH